MQHRQKWVQKKMSVMITGQECVILDGEIGDRQQGLGQTGMTRLTGPSGDMVVDGEVTISRMEFPAKIIFYHKKDRLQTRKAYRR